jgi:Phage Mu protein F like protein
MKTASSVASELYTNTAVKLRAALASSIKPENIVKAYLDTHPTSDDPVRDNARARAWCTTHVSYDMETVKTILKNHYANMYALGLNAGKEQISRIYKARTKGAVITGRVNHKKDQAQLPINQMINPAAFAINWDNWKPGNEAAALLLRTPGGLSKLLGDVNMVTKYLGDTSHNLMGTALARGIAAGKTPVQIANDIRSSISYPERALTISLTEGSRAMISAKQESFVDNGVEQWEWTVTDPEDADCLDVDGEVVNIGDEFSNGLTQPPVHPNCQCDVVPTMPDLSVIGSDQGSSDGEE